VNPEQRIGIHREIRSITQRVRRCEELLRVEVGGLDDSVSPSHQPSIPPPRAHRRRRVGVLPADADDAGIVTLRHDEHGSGVCTIV
jgi:hypothetical protein